mmetsp:Transcript_64683/g.154453  ORF Transcript_64683/g.154453 Transcript_64683/m.154453 type:complete len:292 (+) Transcript_64683:180-1055(+)
MRPHHPAVQLRYVLLQPRLTRLEFLLLVAEQLSRVAELRLLHLQRPPERLLQSLHLLRRAVEAVDELLDFLGRVPPLPLSGIGAVRTACRGRAPALRRRQAFELDAFLALLPQGRRRPVQLLLCLLELALQDLGELPLPCALHLGEAQLLVDCLQPRLVDVPLDGAARRVVRTHDRCLELRPQGHDDLLLPIHLSLLCSERCLDLLQLRRGPRLGDALLALFVLGAPCHRLHLVLESCDERVVVVRLGQEYLHLLAEVAAILLQILDPRRVGVGLAFEGLFFGALRQEMLL